MKDILAKNIKYLRKKLGKSQTDIGLQMNKAHTSIGNWEKQISEPSLSEIEQIASIFEIDPIDLLKIDFQNVHLNEKTADKKKAENVHLKVHPNVHLIENKEVFYPDFKVTVLAEDQALYGQKAAIIPITDIAVAAGGGLYNNDHLEVEDALHLPSRLVKPGHTYLCVKIKGLSMAPTLQDGGYVVIRLLDKSEWTNMPDQRIFVVIDTEGKSYVKRIKNRFKKGFIVMRSDSMDQQNYPTLSLDTNEIAAIWYVEWYFSAKMPNINDQYYHRLQLLEEKVDDLFNNANLIKPK